MYSPVMRDEYDFFAIGNTHLADKSLIVVALPLEAVFLWIEGLRGSCVTESIRNDEANASIRPSFHLVSPSIASQAIVSRFDTVDQEITYAESGKPCRRRAVTIVLTP
jgi:hypothetical protein